MSSSRPHATIRDVAALAGVSIKTVSRVINSQPHVSPEKQALVTEAVAALHFEPNLNARALRLTTSQGDNPGEVDL